MTQTPLDDQLFYVDAVAKTHAIMEQFQGKTVRVAYSGGADSDVVMWLLRACGYDVPAVFYDTGLEYQATWDHLDYMRSQGFQIEAVRSKVTVAVAQHRHGHPFVNKRVSGLLERLQQHNFDFQRDGMKPLDELLVLYPNCRAALRWWCNDFPGTMTNIKQNRWLKEFLITYGLPFAVSGKCCDRAKKDPARLYAKENGVDLTILGIRRAEGGARSTAYKSCFVPDTGHRAYAMYFPIFWWSDKDRAVFESAFNIQHSACYRDYGLTRTGCAGCPFGRKFEEELTAIKTFEPKLYKGISKIFDGSYEWTRKYREFASEQRSHWREDQDEGEPGNESD